MDCETASLSGQRVLVVGLGRFGGGVAVTRWLVEQGASVAVTDTAERASLASSLETIADLDLRLMLGGHDDCDPADFDLAIINPAVDKARSPFFQSLVRGGLPWTTEINLFLERCPCDVIAITGTFGKSTTCSMLAHVLERNVARGTSIDSSPPTTVYLGGNIGRSLLPDLGNMRRADTVVMELSSAQLEDVPRIGWSPGFAIMTNLVPHHLDRYGTFKEYVNAKLNVVPSSHGGVVLVGGGLPEEAERPLAARVKEYSLTTERVDLTTLPIELSVPGHHNQVNAASVMTAGRLLGLEEESVRASLRSFVGLPHRLELVCTRSEVRYYNDSKSTAPATTVRALEAFEGPIVLIAGGQEKNVSWHALAMVAAHGCRAVVGTGESGERLAAEVLQAVQQSEGGDRCFVKRAVELGDAVRVAEKLAQPGDVILFSPGAPSFDRYQNFVERGKAFAALASRRAS